MVLAASLGLGLTYGRYPGCPRSQPALAAEDNLNPECAEEGLGPAQPISECGGSSASQTGSKRP